MIRWGTSSSRGVSGTGPTYPRSQPPTTLITFYISSECDAKVPGLELADQDPHPFWHHPSRVVTPACRLATVQFGIFLSNSALRTAIGSCAGDWASSSFICRASLLSSIDCGFPIRSLTQAFSVISLGFPLIVLRR